MMLIALVNVCRQHLSLCYELSFLLSRLFGFHQFANEESDGKTYNDSYYYFHLSLF